MNAKKGVIALQFNWIYVLIIGGIILLFFIVIVQKQKAYSEEGLAGDIQTDLQAIFSSAFVSTGTSSIIEVPNKEIIFDCDSGTPGFKIGKQNPIKILYAFAPDLIKSDRGTISVFAYDWSMPYRVTNFLYVTSPDARYIIIDDSGTKAEDLDKLLPPNYIVKDGQSRLFIDKSINSYLPANDDISNNYKVRVIYFDNGFDPNGPSGLKGRFDKTEPKEISALYVNPVTCANPEKSIDCYGTLKFFDYNGISWSSEDSEYAGEASLLAAVFSENKEMYDCGMNNAFGRLTNVTEIYINRTEVLADFYGASSSCYDSSVLSSIESIKTAASQKGYSAAYSGAQELKEKNELALTNSCPAIY